MTAAGWTMVDMTSTTSTTGPISDQAAATDPTAPSGASESSPVKRVTRSRDDKYLGGVCGGLAAYAGMDANLLRLLVVLGTIFGLGSLIVIYVAAWLLLPEAESVTNSETVTP
jgi:phage shock protein C